MPGECGECPLLGKHKSARDLSFKTHGRKQHLYDSVKIDFVAVSTWLADKCRQSSLLSTGSVTVIPNPFDLPDLKDIRRSAGEGRLRLIFGAARLDDDVKGFPTFVASMQALKNNYPEWADRISITLYGAIRDASLIDRIPFPVNYTGLLRDGSEIRALYCDSDIVVSTSHYETLPGTLVEGQAFGCLPVSFGRGGQRDIVTDGVTGVIVDWHDDEHARAEAMAAGIIRGAEMLKADEEGVIARMHESVRRKFDARSVAEAYVRLIGEDI